MKFSVHLMTGKEIEIDAKLSEEISTIKKMVHDKAGIPIEDQAIFFGGKKSADHQTLEELNAKEGDNFSLILRVSGGATFKFKDIGNQDYRTERDFSKDAPPYRVIWKGLNLEAKCKTKGCVAYGNLTWVPLKFGKFNIGRQIFNCQCPLCGKQTEEAINIAYYKTFIQVQGKQVGKGVIDKWEETVDGDKLTTFIRGEKTMCDWNYLDIVAKELK